MTDLKLQSGEGILLQTEDAGLYDGHNEISINELYLTNKNIIYTHEVSNGIFSKSETVVDKIPLSLISVINGIVQIELVDDNDYGKSLQLIYKNGERKLLEINESPKKLYPIWKNGIINAANSFNIDFEEESQEQKCNSTKTTSGGRTVFCNQCGKKVDASSKFCNECGASIYIDPSMGGNTSKQSNGFNDISQEERRDKRNTVYEGTLHKCPNCGELLKSFVSVCPSCRYEIRDTKSTNSVKDFEIRLSRIESRIMPQFQEEQSLMKKVFGKDFNKEDEEDEARKNFENQKEREMINLILNYPIPNAREDILEFVLLISSNIKSKRGNSESLLKAWIAKFEQVYKKAEMTLKDSDDLRQIKEIYQRTCNPIKIKKFAMVMLIPLLFSFLLFMGIFEDEPGMFVASLFLFAIIILVSVIYIKRLYK